MPSPAGRWTLPARLRREVRPDRHRETASNRMPLRHSRLRQVRAPGFRAPDLARVEHMEANLRPFCAALDQRVLQWQRGNHQSSLTDTGQDLLCGLWAGHPCQPAQCRQAYLQIAIAQSLCKRDNALWRARSSQRYQSPHSLPPAKFAGLVNALFYQSAGSQKLEQLGCFLRPGGLERVERNRFDDAAVKSLFAPRVVGNFPGN